MPWIARVKVTCPLRPSKSRVAQFVGPTSGEALQKGLKFQPGPGCRKGGIEMIKRGADALTLGGGKRKRRKKRRR